MKQIFLILLFISLVLQGFAQSSEVPFTLDDRDLIMRTEEKVEALQLEMNVKIESLRNEMNAKFGAIESKMDSKFEAVDQRFENLNAKFDLIYWILGIVVVIILFTLGYIIWDRRTALYPVQDKTRNLDE